MSVTGLKAWHLRPGSDFYTSASFDAAVLSLPRGAALIAVLGQIDCREVRVRVRVRVRARVRIRVRDRVRVRVRVTSIRRDECRPFPAGVSAKRERNCSSW